MASAMALKRILTQRTRWVDVCRINQITRPDNLAMIRHLRLAIKEWKPEMQANYTHFAIVEQKSQTGIIYYQSTLILYIVKRLTGFHTDSYHHGTIG